ncbi:hypothetical protein ACQY0O_002306 [Thecaphora frezii]
MDQSDAEIAGTRWQVRGATRVRGRITVAEAAAASAATTAKVGAPCSSLSLPAADDATMGGLSTRFMLSAKAACPVGGRGGRSRGSAAWRGWGRGQRRQVDGTGERLSL